MFSFRDGGPAYRRTVAPGLLVLLCLLWLGVQGTVTLEIGRLVFSSSVPVVGAVRGAVGQGDERKGAASGVQVADVAEAPMVLISEVMVALLAVTDKQGEWV